MDTLSPVHFFLRVDDKFCPSFVNSDQALPTVPSYLYVQLFQICGKAKRDRCKISQAELARACKCSIRSIQSHLRLLSRLEYIQVERDEDSGLNTYILLFSSRVRAQLHQAGIELNSRPISGCPSSFPSAPPAQKLHEGGAKIAPSYIRDQRDPRSPLTPLPSAQGGSSTSAQCGSGVSPVRVQTAQTHPDAHQRRADFERLWSAWPSGSRQNRAGALRIFLALSHDGRLPAVARLLEIVKLFSEQDDRWRRGFAPNLVNWLRDRRWEDELRPASGTPGQLQERKEDPAAAAELRARVRAVHERYGSGVFSAADSPPRSNSAAATTAFRPDSDSPSKLESSFSDLAALWPDGQRKPALNYLRYLSASGALPDPARLVASARDYLSETRKPASLVNWLREQCGVRHAQTPRLCPC